MSKSKRNERIGLIVKVLAEAPNKLFSFKYFTEHFGAAKSSISEDIAIVKRIMQDNGLGKVITIPGASGGVKYIPEVPVSIKTAAIERFSALLNDSARNIPGGFLYMADLLFNPELIMPIGEIFAEAFLDKSVDYVMTIETKGIPMAFMTARFLNVPLVIARKDNRITDGPTISINYISGSSGKLGTMYASKRAMKPKSNVLIVDDFMKGGGTAKGMLDLAMELDAKVVGIAVLVETAEPRMKLIKDHLSLLTVEKGADDRISIYPTKKDSF